MPLPHDRKRFRRDPNRQTMPLSSLAMATIESEDGAAPIGGLLAHRVRSAQSGHPRLSLRRPATAYGRARGDGTRHRSEPAPRRWGSHRSDGIRDHDPGAVYARPGEPGLWDRERI